MALWVEDSGEGISRVGQTNKKLRDLCEEAIEDVDLQFAARSQGARIVKRSKKSAVRIDIQGINQGPDNDQTNIQIQIGSNTVAFILVSRSAITCPDDPDLAAVAEAAATDALQRALTGSLSSKTKWTVTGVP